MTSPGPAGSPASPPRSRLELIVILGAMTSFAPLATDMYLPALPTLQRAFGTSSLAVQATLSAFFAGLPPASSPSARSPTVSGDGRRFTPGCYSSSWRRSVARSHPRSRSSRVCASYRPSVPVPAA
jgi:MFS family permease